ncbi:MAG: type I methionyl aminopeptidase [Deltaproteobacteria bacterium]|nr:type I methionyl aminopeptidase [Deltaproteobacteria bacterium]MBW2393006.1 type I methionyl aminopeptidase [Deltaproteobacteria bacterium]
MKKNKKKARSGGRASRGGRSKSPCPILSPEEADGMRAAGRLACEILDVVAEMIGPGVTTAAVDQAVDEMTRSAGATSAPYGYVNHGTPPFPGHCCTSVNDVVCHGIPDEGRALREGDIVNVDVTPLLNGWHGDSSRTFMIGDVSPVARRLVKDTWHAMWLGIRTVKDGSRVGDIGHAIQTFAEAQGYEVVREFTGHGTGRVFHTPPSILHYGTPGTGMHLRAGMTFTIEPMINLGHWKTDILDDGWTAVTVDGKLSAQWEHTILVTEDGVEVLTRSQDE